MIQIIFGLVIGLLDNLLLKLIMKAKVNGLYFLPVFVIALLVVINVFSERTYASEPNYNSPNIQSSSAVKQVGTITVTTTTTSWSCNNWPPESSRSYEFDTQFDLNSGSSGSVSICIPSCGTCTPPKCPSGTDQTSRDNCRAPSTRCSRGSDGCGGSCGSKTRSCWYLENDPVPDEPENIRYKVGEIMCNLGEETRVPYPVFEDYKEDPDQDSDGFIALGGIDNRLGDIRGRSPLLRYNYRLAELELNSGFLPESSTYAPEIADLVSGSEIHTIYALSNSINRCEGHTSSPEISRSFKVNYVPEVVSIEPVEDPNEGVSGRYDMKDVDHGFDCVVDNPKSFKVVFEDGDGCGDIWEDYDSESENICGGVKTSNISLRAIDSVTEEVFAPETENELSDPYNVSCEGNQLTAYFDLTLLGDENVDLTIQAKVDDIVGDTSGWQSKMDWFYDGIVPELKIKSEDIESATEVSVDWEAKDSSPTRAGVDLSGVRSVRISAHLTKGTILSGDGSYSSITYEGVAVGVNEPFEEWKTALEVDAPYPDSLTDSNLVDIGRNQDGELDFQIEAVDRACNYNNTNDPLELGTPWIATRGGLVHSGLDIGIPVKKSLYLEIIPSLLSLGDERTSLSTELVTSGGGISVEDDNFYRILNYSKRLTRSWSPIFQARLESRNPERSSWSFVEQTGEEAVQIPKAELESNCESGQHIYFVSGNLEVKPDEYELGSPMDVSGCIFIVSGDLTISEGEYKSEGLDVPAYDLVRGYFMVDGEIEIPFVDRDKGVRDGLKVIGGLFATGGEKSVKLGRSLQLKDNLLYPTLIVFHDARYLDIGRNLLGDTFGGGYVRDVGFIE
jgi:hypothetical protein